jgi:threonylcarbamoyladenosine tRNA methylthiotransferase MtaB
MNILNNKKARFHTLGCKLNFAETSSLQDLLGQYGVRPALEGEEADICIINTCSVTEVADHKCRQVIHKLRRENPGAFILVMGCYAQLRPDVIRQTEGVDLVLGMEQKGQVPEWLEKMFARKQSLQESDQVLSACHEAVTVPTAQIKTFVPSCSCGERTRYFLKVQDGCNYYCTYCTIPYARGRSRNGSIASMVEQAREVARRGGKEIVITGVNIGDFGRSTGENFFDLIKALDKVDGIERYRISSIEPNLLTDEIIDYCAQSRAFMPHFHVPLQSGSDDVLKLMRRRYDTAFFAQKMERIREAMPDAFIGVDVIVGTRGETEAYFEDAYRFIDELDISELHVFSYSERPGTKALEIPHIVSPEQKHERSQRLLALSEIKKRAFYQRYVGTCRPVLWEHSKTGRPLHGFTDNYIRVECPTVSVGKDNTLSMVELGDFTADGKSLAATLVE